jgi:hypothetical protein
MILVTMMMEALLSSETSVLTRATWRNIPEEFVIVLVVYCCFTCCIDEQDYKANSNVQLAIQPAYYYSLYIS